MKAISTVLCLVLLGGGCSRSADKSAEPRSDPDLVAMLETDLTSLDTQIREAERDVIEHERLNQVHLIKILAENELKKLEFVVGEKTKLEQELLLLEARHPVLVSTNPLASVTADDALRQRHAEIKQTIEALGEAERRWKSAYVLAISRGSELRRLQDRVRRLEETYSQIAQRLHDLKMKEQLKSLQNPPPDRMR